MSAENKSHDVSYVMWDFQYENPHVQEFLKKLYVSASPVRKPASFFSTEEANAETVHGTP